MSDRGGTIEADVHASEDVSEGVPETRKRQLTETGLVPGLILGDACIYEAPLNYRE